MSCMTCGSQKEEPGSWATRNCIHQGKGAYTYVWKRLGQGATGRDGSRIF